MSNEDIMDVVSKWSVRANEGHLKIARSRKIREVVYSHVIIEVRQIYKAGAFNELATQPFLSSTTTICVQSPSALRSHFKPTDIQWYAVCYHCQSRHLLICCSFIQSGKGTTICAACYTILPPD
jgi:hypothetical protein